MPIAFRCQHCQQLMSISRRKAGKWTICPRCARETRVPALDPAVEVPAAAAAAEEKVDSPQITPDMSLSLLPAPTSASPPTPLPVAGKTPAPPVSSPSFTLAARDADDEAAEDVPALTLSRRFVEEEEMDLTPMVDVTFLLLIFFMVTASFSIQKSLAVPPPDPDEQGAAQTVIPLDELEEKSILIEIDADNRFLVDAEPVQELDDLPSLLAEIRSRDRKNEVLVTVSPQTRHESMVTAIDAAQEVGMQRIRWAVQPED